MTERAARFLGDLRNRAGGIALGALAGTLAWSALEAVVLVVRGASIPRAVCAVSLAALVAAAAGALLCAAAFVGVAGLRSIGALKGLLAPRILLVWLAALIGASFAAYGAVRLFDAVFFGEGVKRLAICAVVPLAALGIGAAAQRLATRVASLPAGRPGPRGPLLAAGAALAALALSVAGFRFLEREVFEALELSQYWPFAITLAGGLLGGALLRPGRRLGWTASALCAAVLAGSIVQVVRGTDGPLRAIVDARTRGTRLVLAAEEALREAGRFSPSSGAQATCFPGKPLPSMDQIPEAPDNAPDIVLLTVDALRWDHTSLAGYGRSTTPELKRWAAQGTVFSACFTSSSSTRQVFPVLFTGLLPAMVRPAPGGRSWGPKMTRSQGTLAEYLEAAGYATVAIVSDSNVFNEKNNSLGGFGTIDNTVGIARKRARYSASFQVDRIISHMSTYRKDSPMFVWAHLMDTHQPYRAGPHPVSLGKGNVGRYDSSIRFVDEQIGRLLAFARGSARRDKTYLIVSADHGQAFREHGNKLHGSSLYQEETHVPLVVWGPRVKRQRITAPVSLVDLVPSILDAAGIPPFEALCGASLKPVWEKRSGPPDRPVYLDVWPDDMRSYVSVAFIEGAHQLIVDPRTGTKELYDLEKDPSQKEDLAAAQPGVVSAMSARLVDFYVKRGIDPAPYGLNAPR
jgi:arylsulfatase A-like enzyme